MYCPAVPDRAPDTAFGVDREAIRPPVADRDAGKLTSPAKGSGRRIAIIGMDQTGYSVHKIEGAAVGAPAQAVRHDDPTLLALRCTVGADAIERTGGFGGVDPHRTDPD